MRVRYDERWTGVLMKKMKMETMMATYEFSVIASGLDPHDEDFEARFYEAGCNDATVSFQKGSIIVDFARDAESLEAAISSAFLAVRSTGATVKRIEPDPLVSLSDISFRSGLTRSATSNYASGKRGCDFPAPVARVMSDSPLWDWAVVARWMVENDKLPYAKAYEAEVFAFANAMIGGAVDTQPVDFSARLHGHAAGFTVLEVDEVCIFDMS